MNFKTCIRCGCFFASDSQICPSCQSKDEIDKNSIKNYLANNDIPANAETLASNSGVSIKNMNRFMQTKEFSSLKNAFDNSDITQL